MKRVKVIKDFLTFSKGDNIILTKYDSDYYENKGYVEIIKDLGRVKRTQYLENRGVTNDKSITKLFNSSENIKTKNYPKTKKLKIRFKDNKKNKLYEKEFKFSYKDGQLILACNVPLKKKTTSILDPNKYSIEEIVPVNISKRVICPNCGNLNTHKINSISYECDACNKHIQITDL